MITLVLKAGVTCWGGINMRIGFLGLLGLLFIGLKLAGAITWSWWFVLLPLYAIPLFFVLTSVVLVIAAASGGGKKF